MWRHAPHRGDAGLGRGFYTDAVQGPAYESHIMKEAVHEAEHVLHDVALVGGAALGVRVEPAAAVRHDHDERHARHVALDGRAPRPDGVIVGEAVEEVEHGVGPRLLRVLGQDHRHAGLLPDRITEEAHAHVGHGGGSQRKEVDSCQLLFVAPCSLLVVIHHS